MKNIIFYLKIFIIVILVYKAVSFVSFSIPSKNIAYMDSKLTLIEKNNFSNNLISYLYKDEDNKYIGKVFNSKNNTEMNLSSLINMDKYESYRYKIQELLYLKYPKFIVESLLEDNTQEEYLFRNNELVIFFNNYYLEYELNEILYLTVNYNEIKEYLTFKVDLDTNYQNESGYNYNNSKKSVSITFDDSPNIENTPKILKHLQDNLMHATFFTVGEKMENNIDILISIKQYGNEIGSHTYSHQNLYKLTDYEVWEDYNKVNDIYKNIFHENIKYFRPPYGNIKETQQYILPVSYILWSLDTNDWRYRRSEYLVNYVVGNIKDGDIILFHDTYESTERAIKELLPILYSKGYQVMSVSELFKLKGINLKENEKYYSARIEQ